MKYLSFGAVLLASAAAVGAQTPAGKADEKAAKEPVTLTGCVETGKDADTFVLTHVVRSDSAAKDTAGLPQPSIANPTATPPIASPTGTTGTDPNAPAYTLDSPEKLKAHVGHKVSVVGTVDEDTDKAAKEGAAAAPDAGAAKAGEKPSYKVKVKSVTMISSSCS